MLTALKKAKHPCSVCARRKVKCDRLIPCTNCIKRGQEDECVQAGKSDADGTDCSAELLQFWHTYEYWVVDVGLLKFERCEPAAQFEELVSQFGEMQLLMDLVSVPQSYKLLDYAAERLGPLYFGCLSDIGEVYVRLEDYWRRREEDAQPNVDECYWDALLWAIFTQAIYYMAPDKLASIFPQEQVRQVLEQETDGLEEEGALQLTFLHAFTRCVITQLYSTNFMAHPDVRIIQIYLILCNTTFPFTNSLLSNALLLQCFHIAKMFHVDDFRPLINDSTVLRLTKATCEKLWYRLCASDYLQSSPQRYISFHSEISSLLQHAAYLEDLPNTDVYQSEDSFEVLYWKLISLDRDLEQYLTAAAKPPPKTLDAIQRQTEIFHVKISNSTEEESFGSEWKRFLATFLLSSVCWKLYKMYFIYYDTSDSLASTLHYSRSLISLVVNNVSVQNRAFFNRHPLVLRSLSRVAAFYAFLEVFIPSTELEQILADFKELLPHLPPVFESKFTNLNFLVDRFDALKVLWEKVRTIDSKNTTQHPVIKILKNDVERISDLVYRRPSLISGAGLLRSKNHLHGEVEAAEDNESREFKLVVSEFERQFTIDSIIV